MIERKEMNGNMLQIKNKRIRRAVTALLCAGLLLALTVPGFAADGIDLNRTCTLTVAWDVNPNVYNSELKTDNDLELMTIPVYVYRVAEISESAAYTASDAYREASVYERSAETGELTDEAMEASFGKQIAGLSDRTTAAEWSLLAEAARLKVLAAAAGKETLLPSEAETLDIEALQEALQATADGSATLTVGSGRAAIDGLKPGLYLVFAQTAQTTFYNYSFSPYLISLPNNYSSYESSDNTWNYGSSAPEQNDTWYYGGSADPVVAGLKPQQIPRTGDVVVEKYLPNYNASLGKAVFVYHVTATITDKRGNVTTLHDDMHTLIFDGSASTKQFIIKDLPSGAAVTVEEVYSGACYRQVSGPEFYLRVHTEEGITFLADTEETRGSYDDTRGTAAQTVIANPLTGAPLTVRFANDYDETLIYGTGVVNSFDYAEDGEGTGGHTWDQAQAEGLIDDSEALDTSRYPTTYPAAN